MPHEPSFQQVIGFPDPRNFLNGETSVFERTPKS
jgi:hypothetical protein